MEDLTNYLLIFLTISFLIETMILIGVFISGKSVAHKQPKGKYSIFSFIKEFHRRNMNAINNGNQLKDIGLKFIYLGVFAGIVEFFYNIYFVEQTGNLLGNIHQLFVNWSSAITIMAAGFAFYAFGVTLVGNQKNRENQQIK